MQSQMKRLNWMHVCDYFSSSPSTTCSETNGISLSTGVEPRSLASLPYHGDDSRQVSIEDELTARALESIQTKLYGPLNAPFFTYNNVPWTLHVRKEVCSFFSIYLFSWLTRFIFNPRALFFWVMFWRLHVLSSCHIFSFLSNPEYSYFHRQTQLWFIR